jgi:hypothetical protein
MALTQVQGGMLAGSTNTTTTIQSNGTTAITIDSSQNVGIGTSSPTVVLDAYSTGTTTARVRVTGTTNYAMLQAVNSGGNLYCALDSSTGSAFGVGNYSAVLWNGANSPLVFATNNAERMRILSGGALLVGTTAEPNNANNGFKTDSQYTIMASSGQPVLYVNRNANTGVIQEFRYNNGAIGNVSTNGSNCTFNSTSDYRLKENILPMTGALAKVSQLKPVTYQWKIDGQYGEGFIAHELAEVCPEAVTGEKDAVELVDIKDEEGNVIGQEEKPVYQAIDQSVLVATLTAAIQELNAKVEAQAAEIAALKVAK